MPLTIENIKNLLKPRNKFKNLLSSKDKNTHGTSSDTPVEDIDDFVEQMITEIESDSDVFEQKFKEISKPPSKKITRTILDESYLDISTTTSSENTAVRKKLEDISFLKKYKKTLHKPTNRVMYNYLLYVYKIYNSINLELGKSETKEDIAYKKKLLVAALRDKHAQILLETGNSSKLPSKKKSAVNNLSKLSDYPNLTQLELSIFAAEENKNKKPFVSYNGAVIFSLTDAQRKILEDIDEKLKTGNKEAINLSLGVGKGKSFLSELIEKIYGSPYHGSHIDAKNTKKEFGGIYIGDTLVGYSTAKVDPKKIPIPLDKKDKFCTFDYDSKNFPLAKIETLSLKDVSDLDVAQLDKKIDEVIAKLNSTPKSANKMVIFDEFPHINYTLRKHIRKRLPENEYNLVFISATPNVELLNILYPDANDKEKRKEDDSYDIKAIEIEEDPIIFEKNIVMKCQF